MKSDRLPKEVQTEWTLNDNINDTATFMFGKIYFGQIRNESNDWTVFERRAVEENKVDMVEWRS